jgi:hypothetical protein
MILPQPEGNLSLNTIVLGSEIIDILKKQKSKNIIIDDVMFSFLGKNKRTTPDNFLDALTFLYALGLVDYENYRIRMNPNGNS